jgi:Notch-like protein
LDDNCDGTTDEGNPEGGAACATGLLGLCNAGTFQCQNGQLQCAQTVQPTTELCNGLDDDCDGTVDEGNPEGGSSCSTGQLGVCAAGTQICANGSLGCQPNQTAGPETCDGLDNDCDGGADEGDPGGGLTCSTGVPGPCADGVTQCSNGGIVCNQTTFPATEICDGGLDNDCDGSTDEGCSCTNGQTQSCYNGASGTQGVGLCVAGTQTCSGGSWGSCVGETTPVTDVCDGLDNDCDGTADQGNPGGNVACTTGQSGICSAGTTQCSGGSIVCNANNTATSETCDGLDNDCDGTVDDGNPGGGQGCSTGQTGVCAAGTTQCSGGSIICNANSSPSPELCDGLDNDCDGGTDEGDPGGNLACSTGVPGVCASGLTQCSGGGIVCNQTTFPSAEVCEGSLDDDCDGTVDDGCSCTNGQTLSCYSGANGTVNVGLCVAGIETCVAGSWTACAGEVIPTTEVCDGSDNDCNGSTDEGDPGGGGSCNTGLNGVCAVGTLHCSGGSLGCVPNTSASTEICDGLDNDCDAFTDENDPGGGQACNSGQQGECAAGTTQCSGGGIICNANAGPVPEICDGLDNDCDGGADEGDPGGGLTCNTGIPGICADGVTQCSGGGVICNQVNFPGTEICDGGIDNDCDGGVDEGCVCTNGQTQACYNGANGTLGVGLCVAGLQTCSGGAWGACVGEVVPTAEVCNNGQDDDCDNNTDEGCGITVTLDAYQRGWWSSLGAHTSTNDNTYTGRSGVDLYNSYFSFDLTGVTGTVIAAELRLELEYWAGTDPSETCTIWDVSTAATTLEATGTSVPIYTDLMTGNQYGSNVFLSSGIGTVYTMSLSAQALSDIQTALGTNFSVGVTVDTITLPSGSEGLRFSASSEARIHQLVLTML